MQRDLVQLIGEGTPGSIRADAGEPLLKRPPHGFGLGISGEPGQGVCKLLGFTIPDV